MTFIITATVAAAAVYFIAALVCFIHDGIQARRHRTAQKAIATVKTEPKPIAKPQTRFESLTIRELKKEASKAKVKKYSSMTKAQLIAALT